MVVVKCFNCSQSISDGSQKLLSDTLDDTPAVNGQHDGNDDTILDVISKVFQVDRRNRPGAFKELKAKQDSAALCEDCEVALGIVYGAKRDFEALCKPFSFLSNFLFKTNKPVKPKLPPPIPAQLNTSFKSTPTPSSKSKDNGTAGTLNKVKPKTKPKARPARPISMLIGLDQSNIIDTTSRVASNNRRNSSTVEVTSDSLIPKKINNQKEQIVLKNLEKCKEIETEEPASTTGGSKITKLSSKANSKSKIEPASPAGPPPATNSAPSFKINCNNCSVVFYSLDEASKHNCLQTNNTAASNPLPVADNDPVLQKPKVIKKPTISSSSKTFSKYNPRNECRHKGCKMKFDTFDKLQAHIKTHVENLLCNYCGSGYSRNRDIYHHIKIKHKGASSANIFKPNSTSSIDQVQEPSASAPPPPTKIKEVKTFSKYNSRNECRNKGCTMKFDTFDKLQTHIKTHVESLLCNYCGSGYSRNQDIYQHIKRKHKGASLVNIIKQNSTSPIDQVQKEPSASALAPPTKIKEVKTLQKCNYPNCFKEFENKGSLLNHYKCHFQGRKVECEICGHLFLSTYKKERHKRQVHRRIKSGGTTAPSTTTTTNKKRKRAAFVSKNSGGEFVCEYPGCNQSFISAFSLRGHKGYHSRTKSNLVHVQDPKIQENINMSKSKMKTEAKSDEIKFKCQFCPIEYSTFKSKREHERVKHRFEREFAMRAKLEQEKNKETSNISKPGSPEKVTFNFTTWKCELCSRNFITKSIRDNHMKNSHPGIFNKTSSNHEKASSNKAPSKIISKSKDKINNSANSTKIHCKICKTKFSNGANYRRHMNTTLHKSNVANSTSNISSSNKPKSNSDAEARKNGYLPLVVINSDEDDDDKKGRGRTTTNSIGSLSDITDEFSKIVSSVGITKEAPITFSCDQCDKVFQHKKSLVAHEKSHISRERDFICGICSVAFLTHHHLDRHIRSQHLKKNGSEPAKYKCKMCVKIFDSQDDLDEHTNEKHSDSSSRSSPLDQLLTEKSKFECNFCDTCYPTADKLFEHFRSDLHKDTIARERENDFKTEN